MCAPVAARYSTGASADSGHVHVSVTRKADDDVVRWPLAIFA